MLSMDNRNARTPRLLLIDDNRDYAQTMSMLLAGCGWDVVTAHDGTHGLALASHLQPDCMLVDLAMPGLNGYQLLAAVRADAALQGTYVAAVSGWGGNDESSRSLAAGFDAHFMKPCDYRQLLAVLERAWASRRPATVSLPLP